MSSNISIAFTDLKTRGTTVTREKSTFLCYADATLVVAADRTEILQLRLRNMQLKVVNGAFRVDFHSEKGNDGQWYPTAFPKSAVSRKRLTAAIKRAYAQHVSKERALAGASDVDVDLEVNVA
jgi:hypothetical protein